jgi:hypothetical protein
MVNREDGQVSVLAFTVDAGRITTIHIQRNPEKLRQVAELLGRASPSGEAAVRP